MFVFPSAVIPFWSSEFISSVCRVFVDFNDFQLHVNVIGGRLSLEKPLCRTGVARVWQKAVSRTRCGWGAQEQKCFPCSLSLRCARFHCLCLVCGLAGWLVGWLVECCFTSTETVGLLGTGAQDGHLDFYTAPELCDTSTETVGLLGTGAQDGHLDSHTAPEL